MEYQPHQIYHVFNQGNNRQPIFFRTENYHYFLRKMKRHITPFADILCYCLMPNHFHWLIYVRPEGCNRSGAVKPRKKYFTPGLDIQSDFQQVLSHKIGVILSSYTRAINIQENRSGSLFRAKTKVKNSFYNSDTEQNVISNTLETLSGRDYLLNCFEYIHKNPVSASLVIKVQDWKFSSAKDYLGLRKDTICNITLTENIIWKGM